MPTMTKALAACYHMERRYRTDADFAHVMHMTESMEKIQTAINEHQGKPAMTMQDRLHDQQRVHHKWDGRVRQLENEVSELERKLEAAQECRPYVSEADERQEDSARYALMRVSELMDIAAIRGINITPDQLSDAIAGIHVLL